MLMKHKLPIGDDYFYARVERINKKQAMLFDGGSSKEVAILNGAVGRLSSIKDLEKYGYSFIEPSMETLSVGDYIQNSTSDRARVLMAQGNGKYRTYILSHATKNKSYPCSEADEQTFFNRPYLANELKENWKPLTWKMKHWKEKEETVEITVEGKTKHISKASAKELNLI